MNGNPLYRIGGGLKSFVQVVAAARQATVEYQHLNRMSDRELARRGISRGDIPNLVVRAVGL